MQYSTKLSPKESDLSYTCKDWKRFLSWIISQNFSKSITKRVFTINNPSECLFPKLTNHAGAVVVGVTFIALMIVAEVQYLRNYKKLHEIPSCLWPCCSWVIYGIGHPNVLSCFSHLPSWYKKKWRLQIISLSTQLV